MRWALVAMLTAAGCSAQGLQSVHGQQVYVESAVPADAALAALTMWNEATGIDLAVTADPGIADITIANATDCGPGHLGYDDEGSTTAVICLSSFAGGATDSQVTPTIAHELGHVMGLHHIPAITPALMNHDEGPQTITAADVDQFSARWGH